MKHAVTIEGLSKQYAIGAAQSQERNFREAILGAVLAPIYRLRRLGGKVAEEDLIWALRDVTFAVAPGDVVGIVGHNGAGKSTLLKILSRITDPTKGRVTLRGRVASLLEVGTGFHPELTGRENIYLNGAILGLSRAEIRRKFDAIIDFSGVEKFLDTPVKRYSSGMQTRLAFSVAAHLEAEILLIDEVLAVGDAEFQRKCLGKMNDVAQSGRTVLFVSHNMSAVRELCSRCLLLNGGRLQMDGETGEVMQAYLTLSLSSDTKTMKHSLLERATLTDARNVGVTAISPGEELQIDLHFRRSSKGEHCRVFLTFTDHLGVKAMTLATDFQFGDDVRLNQAKLLRCLIRNLRLAPGIYTISYSLWSGSSILEKGTLSSFAIHNVNPYRIAKPIPRWVGVYLPETTWTLSEADHVAEKI